MASKEANCRSCKTKFLTSEMVKRISKRKGYYYVCNNCLDFTKFTSDKMHYDFSTIKKGKVAFIIKFQFSHKSTFNDFDILRDEYNWNIAMDKDKHIYLKSCLYTSKNAMPKAWESLDALVDIESWNNEYDYLTPCYAYVKKISEQYYDIVEENYFKIFKAIYDVLLVNPNLSYRVFGAIPIDGLCTEEELKSFFVDVKDNFLIFKFCKYRTASQYVETIKIIEEICKKIDTWFVKVYEEKDFDKISSNNIDEHLNHRISKLASSIERMVSNNY